MICSSEKVLSNINIIDDIYEIKISGKFSSIPGQFYMLKPVKSTVFLSRPISVYAVDDEAITFLYQVIGKGTKDMKDMIKDDEMQILGPLGNGFDLDSIKGKVALVAGGIGIAPLIGLARELTDCNIDFYAGFRNNTYAVDTIKDKVDNIFVSTEDGSHGHKGYVTDLLTPENYDMIITCGPLVMMKKLIAMASSKNVPILVSMENKMACGLGACLGCTCKTKDGNKTVCETGPVFKGEDLIFDDK